MSFQSLQNNRGNALAALQNKVKESASGGEGGGTRDPRKWKVSYNKETKIGSAVIRFLPFGAGGRLPWAEWIEFSFKGKGGNYWERSLKTIGKDDPVAELNHLQWERNQGNDQDEVRKRGRRLRYIANIVVVSDPAHPENNGKVFLFEYGPAIHKKIIAKMVPEYEDMKPVNVFDMWEGATFRIRTKDKSGYLNYDDSEFDAPAVLHDDNNVLEMFYNGMHDLTEFEAESNYKTFEELDKNMRKVLGAAYCASILGEEFSPDQAAGAAAGGSNPFPAAGGGQAPAGNPNPFGGQQTAPAQQQTDPFANQAPAQQAPAQQADPFANQAPAGDQGQAATPAAPATDPFANMGGSAPSGGNSDPFADLNLG